MDEKRVEKRPRQFTPEARHIAEDPALHDDEMEWELPSSVNRVIERSYGSPDVNTIVTEYVRDESGRVSMRRRCFWQPGSVVDFSSIPKLKSKAAELYGLRPVRIYEDTYTYDDVGRVATRRGVLNKLTAIAHRDVAHGQIIAANRIVNIPHDSVSFEYANDARDAKPSRIMRVHEGVSTTLDLTYDASQRLIAKQRTSAYQDQSFVEAFRYVYTPEGMLTRTEHDPVRGITVVNEYMYNANRQLGEQRRFVQGVEPLQSKPTDRLYTYQHLSPTEICRTAQNRTEVFFVFDQDGVAISERHTQKNGAGISIFIPREISRVVE